MNQQTTLKMAQENPKAISNPSEYIPDPLCYDEPYAACPIQHPFCRKPSCIFDSHYAIGGDAPREMCSPCRSKTFFTDNEYDALYPNERLRQTPDIRFNIGEDQDLSMDMGFVRLEIPAHLAGCFKPKPNQIFKKTKTAQKAEKAKKKKEAREIRKARRIFRSRIKADAEYDEKVLKHMQALNTWLRSEMPELFED